MRSNLQSRTSDTLIGTRQREELHKYSKSGAESAANLIKQKLANEKITTDSKTMDLEIQKLLHNLKKSGVSESDNIFLRMFLQDNPDAIQMIKTIFKSIL